VPRRQLLPQLRLDLGALGKAALGVHIGQHGEHEAEALCLGFRVQGFRFRV